MASVIIHQSSREGIWPSGQGVSKPLPGGRGSERRAAKHPFRAATARERSRYERITVGTPALIVTFSVPISIAISEGWRWRPLITRREPVIMPA